MDLKNGLLSESCHVTCIKTMLLFSEETSKLEVLRRSTMKLFLVPKKATTAIKIVSKAVTVALILILCQSSSKHRS